VEVVFTPEARETLQFIVSFIESKWGKKSAGKFKDTAIKVVKTISTQPYMFKASVIDTNVRQGIITKQTSVLYEVYENHVLILYFWDNRQDPIIIEKK
jgi:plasmid stabilization system protein ParE